MDEVWKELKIFLFYKKFLILQGLCPFQKIYGTIQLYSLVTSDRNNKLKRARNKFLSYRYRSTSDRHTGKSVIALMGVVLNVFSFERGISHCSPLHQHRVATSKEISLVWHPIKRSSASSRIFWRAGTGDSVGKDAGYDSLFYWRNPSLQNICGHWNQSDALHNCTHAFPFHCSVFGNCAILSNVLSHNKSCGNCFMIL